MSARSRPRRGAQGGARPAHSWERPYAQDLWVPDDRADLPECLLPGLLHFDVGVGEHPCELGHNVGQAGTTAKLEHSRP